MSNAPRRPLAHISPTSINHLHLRNPLVMMWFSAAFPGFGHLLLCKFGQGFLLIFWEFFANVNSGINLSIYYSMLGDFHHAKQSLEMKWAILYVGVYLYAIWDSYRFTIVLNKMTLLADASTVVPLKISPMEINPLYLRRPWIATIWSLFLPGLGQLYTNRLVIGFMNILWWVVSCYYSNFNKAIYFTAIGRFGEAASVINPEWLLFLPSLYCFAIYDAFINCIELNKLFVLEQKQYLKKKCRIPRFQLPFGYKGA